MLERGSAVDAQPIKGFSHLSLVSNSIFHFFVLFTPDCMLLRAGTKILTFLVLMCSSGTPVKVVISSFSSTVISCVSRVWLSASFQVDVLNNPFRLEWGKQVTSGRDVGHWERGRPDSSPSQEPRSSSQLLRTDPRPSAAAEPQAPQAPRRKPASVPASRGRVKGGRVPKAASGAQPAQPPPKWSDLGTLNE